MSEWRRKKQNQSNYIHFLDLSLRQNWSRDTMWPFLVGIWNAFTFTDQGFVSPIRSDPIQSDPVQCRFVNGLTTPKFFGVWARLATSETVYRFQDVVSLLGSVIFSRLYLNNPATCRLNLRCCWECQGTLFGHSILTWIACRSKLWNMLPL